MDQDVSPDQVQTHLTHPDQSTTDHSDPEQEYSLDDACALQAVKLARYTGIYDKDKNGVPETLIVYIRPIDMDGDIVKAPGSVGLQLWDLSEGQNGALLEQWEMQPQVLRKQWLSTLMSTGYRLTFKLSSEHLAKTAPLTLRMTFKHLLTGVSFCDQIVAERR